MDQYNVAKFGGSSVADITAMSRCSKIIENDPSIKLVVVSATYNTTNQLEELVKLALSKKESEVTTLFEEISLRHHNMLNEINASEEKVSLLSSLLTELKNLVTGVCLLGDCSRKTMDQIYSFGERSSSLIFSENLQSTHEKNIVLLDARETLRTNDKFGMAIPDTKTIKKLIHEKWGSFLQDNNVVIVTQGFIGSTIDHYTTTLGREGSDFSATLFAEAINAGEIQIWKDVTGIASTDPRIIERVKYIPELSYSEMSELSTLGAKVLHPFTLQPAIRANIPVYVASSMEPEVKGTWIKNETSLRPLVSSLALREEQTLVTLTLNKRIGACEFFAKVFDILYKNNIPLTLVNTYENHLSFLLNKREALKVDTKAQLEKYCQIKEEDHLALVSLVGHNMDQSSGFMTRLFAFLDRYKIRQVNFGTGKHSLSLLVNQSKSLDILKLLHHTFIETPTIGEGDL